MSTITLAEAQASPNAEVDADYVSASLSVTTHVMPTDKYVPMTGVHATEVEIDGWEWDKRRLENWSEDRTRYGTFLGGHRVGLTDGTRTTDWQSGNVVGLEYEKLRHLRDVDAFTWTPQVQVGEFSIHQDMRALYSDHSFSENVDPATDVTGGIIVKALHEDVVNESVQAAIFHRTTDFLIQKFWDFELVDEFTGAIDTGTNTLLDTGDPPAITVANLSERHREILVFEDDIYFNGDYQIAVGDVRVALVSVVGTWEDKGCGLDAGRQVFSKYFPFAPATVRVVTVDSAGVVTTWTEQPNLNFSTSADQHYSVDYDLGVITMGGFQAPNLVLKTAITAVDTALEVFHDPDILAAYPDSGRLLIGTEEIAYTSKTRSGFAGLTRGYNGTVAAVHSVGDIVEDTQHGAGTTDGIFISYTASPRIDYEVTDYTLRTANKSPWLDIRPASNVVTNNIVQVLSANINLAEIVLETDAPLIGGDLYGPVFYGTDVAKLTARGLDARGNPVDDVELTIEIVEGDGSLNGADQSYTTRSNTLGEIYAYYNAPYGVDQMDLEVLAVSHVGADTEMTVEQLSSAASANDIWVFQVLKHDPIFGTVGVKSVVDSGGLQPRPGSAGFLEVDGFFGEQYQDGIVYVLQTNGVKRQFNIKDVTHSLNGSGQKVTYLWTEQAPFPGLVTGQDCWLIPRDGVEWDSTQKRGARVILYEYSVGAQHPITGVAGAYTPVHPNSVAGTTLTFTGRNLPIPAPEDDTNNLGAYIVVAPTEVKFQAWGRDPFSGNIIKSNFLRLELNLPNWLVGVDSSGTLPIPYGFTLVTESFNIGAGLEGANFITVNPAATGINQFGITGVFP